MKVNPVWATALALLLALTTLAAPAGPDIIAQSRELLDAYVRGDEQRVLSRIDSGSITIYGSDAAEIFHGGAAVKSMLVNDQKLWGGTAHFGPMEHVAIVQTKDLASIFFDASFSVGNRRPVPVRFAMTWRRFGKRWLLVQSSNVVATEGQSAEQLLKGQP